ncbi:hypothetical protein [Chitinivorax sp. B]|uniref:hypothetical protein n=1 Tax=Chitinivorax sp. B TaxID=2502235 RepID=UPI0010F4ADC9|nr:hypothetical protein [Chitinivorax sp. B]
MRNALTSLTLPMLLMLTACDNDTSSQSTDYSTAIAQLQQSIRQNMATHQVTDLTVALVNDQRGWRAGFGSADTSQ